MSKKGLEERSSMERHCYLDKIQETNVNKSSEQDEFMELSNILANEDFSINSNREAVLQKVMKNINESGREAMIKRLNIRKRFAVATALAICIMSASLAQTSLAQGFVAKVLNTISLGHIVVNQMEPMKVEKVPVPSILKGKIFDVEGNVIEEFDCDYNGKYYTAAEEEIATFSFSDGEIVTVEEEEEVMRNQKLIVKDPKELNQYTCFDVILPSYLPEGYSFEKAEFYKNENEVVSDKYMDLYFTNVKTGKYIYMQQRFADEETGYETGTDGKIEQVEINGVDAIIMDGSSIHWEANNVLYSLLGRGEIEKNNLIKIAESLE